MVIATVTSGILETFQVPIRTTGVIAATESIKYAAYRISRDVKMAGTTNLIDGALPVGNLTLDWTSWYDSNRQLNDTYYRCKYTLSGGKLQRQYGSYDPGTQVPTPPIIPDSSFTWQEATTVASYITGIQFSSEAVTQGKRILVTVSSSLAGGNAVARQMNLHLYLLAKENPVQ